jgi:hypothetical protein
MGASVSFDRERVKQTLLDTVPELRRRNNMAEDDLVWLTVHPSRVDDVTEILVELHPTAIILDADGRVNEDNFYVTLRRIDFIIAEQQDREEDEDGEGWKKGKPTA